MLLFLSEFALFLALGGVTITVIVAPEASGIGWAAVGSFMTVYFSYREGKHMWDRNILSLTHAGENAERGSSPS